MMPMETWTRGRLVRVSSGYLESGLLPRSFVDALALPPCQCTLPGQVRKVNSELFVGLGYIIPAGGKYNNIPFILEGPPSGKFRY